MRYLQAIGVACLALILVAAGDDANKTDQAAMQGSWGCDKFVRDGMTFPDDDAQALFRTVKDDTFTVQRFRKKASSGKFKLDATKSPKQIDFILDPKGAVLKGIYKIENGKLTLCYGGPKGERPEKFESKEMSGVVLAVWSKEK